MPTRLRKLTQMLYLCSCIVMGVENLEIFIRIPATL